VVQRSIHVCGVHCSARLTAGRNAPSSTLTALAQLKQEQPGWKLDEPARRSRPGQTGPDVTQAVCGAAAG
jgi:hypothetical protein